MQLQNLFGTAGRVLILACFGLGISVGLAAQPAVPPRMPAAERSGIEGWVEHTLRSELTAKLGPPVVDAEWRDAWQAVWARHQPRIRATLLRWAEEEYAADPQASSFTITRRLRARYINEIVLWQLSSTGAEHDRRQMLAWSRPTICRTGQHNSNLADRQLLAVQALPASERAAHMADEERLLAAWGETRAPEPPRPVRDIEHESWTMIEGHLKTSAALPHPLPPVLAWQVAVDTPSATLRLDPGLRCELRRWVLIARQRATPPPDPVPMRVWRLAGIPLPSDWQSQEAPAATEPDAYPWRAAQFEVEGVVRLEATVDAAGKLLGSVVVDRRITVPGIRGQRPVAFETLLDEAAQARMARLPAVPPDAATLRGGRTTRQVDIVFKLH